MTDAISRRTFTGLATMGTAGFLAGCQHNAELGRDQFILIPDSWLAWLSENSWNQIVRSSRLVSGTQENRMLERVGTKVADKSGRTDVNWEFALLDNRVPNAFVLPGGKVAFHTGMLPLAANEAKVAAVMGHETGHVTARHAAERVSQTLAAQGAVLAAKLYFSGQMDKTTQRLVFAALGAGVTYGMIMPFSRQHEYEADMLGLRYMAEAGYDPRDTADFWRTMIEVSKARGQPLEFLSTHPANDKRLAEIEAQLPGVLPIYEQTRQG